jgi:protein involved in polysaccharide export with SLBB domain
MKFGLLSLFFLVASPVFASSTDNVQLAKRAGTGAKQELIALEKQYNEKPEDLELRKKYRTAMTKKVESYKTAKGEVLKKYQTKLADMKKRLSAVPEKPAK